MQFVDCLTDRSVPKESTVTSCMYLETLAKNSGRPTGTCTCLQTVASEGAAETAGNQRGTETDHGGNVTAAEARRGLKDPTAGGTATGGEAGAERGGHLTRERKNGHQGPDKVTGETIDIAAGAGNGREAGVGVETEREKSIETGVETKTGIQRRGEEVKRGTVRTDIQRLREKLKTGPEAQV